MATPTARPKVLCVDDEPRLLEGIVPHLRRHYEVHTAGGGAAALDLLGRDRGFAVVMSDMRMPGMDGATFLAKARGLVPEATRILLTGQTDLDSAIAAVNDGQIFRFLTKPCPAPALLTAIGAAADLHRLVTAEKVLLEQTLHGSIKALTDILAITHPAAFGRATRIKRRVSELATDLELEPIWQVEVAAMLSQVGYVVLPAETLDKAYFGRALTEAEQAMVAKVPATTEQLLANIPRLEAVREILATYPRPHKAPAAGEDPRKASILRAASLLRVAIDADALEAQGTPPGQLLALLRSRTDTYDPVVLDVLGLQLAAVAPVVEIREVPLSGLRVGMVLAADVMLTNGPLLVARGFEVTAAFVTRALNFRAGMVQEPLRVIIKKA